MSNNNPLIKKDSIKRTNLSCPCIWEASSVDAENDYEFQFRQGRLKIFHNKKMIIEDSKDEFDIGAYLSDEDLIKLLIKNDLLVS